MKRPTVVQLPDDLANMIAAGEVVTRPASVVKELVDNAIDAGARRIDVEITHGGSERIRVVDDGHGMTLADARLALVRHATSKIRTAADLDNISTMGFRGEALPSIAAVSKLLLRTRVEEEDAGWELSVSGGGAVSERPCGCPVGTSIEVSDLFFNVPARRKFLRALSTESAHASAVVRGMALAHPEVAVVFRRDGRENQRYAVTDTRAERVREVLRERALWHCSASRGPMHIEAYLSRPERGRQGAGGLHLFVNQRNIVDRAIIRAIASAYGDTLDRGHYPRGAVFITLPAELVDVNVHPQKAEVRFAHARAVTDAVFATVSAELATQLQVPTFARPASFKPQSQRDSGAAWAWSAAPGSHGQQRLQDDRGARAVSAVSAAAQQRAAGDDSSPSLPSATTPSHHLKPNITAQTPSPKPSQTNAASKPPAIGDTAPAPGAVSAAADDEGLLANLKQRYLVCCWHDEVLLIDGVKAEKARLQQLASEAMEAGGLASQRLLFPQVERIGPAAEAGLDHHQVQLAQCGFDIRAAGSGNAMLHAVPRLFGQLAPTQLLRPLLPLLAARSALPKESWLAALRALSHDAAAQLVRTAATDRTLWRWLLARAQRDGRDGLVGVIGALPVPSTP